MRLTVMTFNIRGSFHEDGTNAWEKRRNLNLATIRHQNADIIGFQEVQSGNHCDYNAFLTNYESERGPLAIRQTEHYHLVPVYWKRARFSRLDGGGFYLSPTPETWSLGWGATLVRAATWVRLRERATGSQVVILNTHFAHEPGDDLAREESARLIVGQLARIGNGAVPRIVTGDFNATPESAASGAFRAGGYTDAWSGAGHSDAVNTFHGFEGDAYGGHGERIDWIMIHPGPSRLQVHGCVIVTDAAPPIYPSDHYPVVADVELS